MTLGKLKPRKNYIYQNIMNSPTTEFDFKFKWALWHEEPDTSPPIEPPPPTPPHEPVNGPVDPETGESR